MTLTTEVRSALSLLERLQRTLRGSDEPRLGVQCTNDLNTLISVLHNPFLNKIVNIQDSLNELKKELSRHPSLLPSDFEICANKGTLRLYPPSSVSENGVSPQSPLVQLDDATGSPESVKVGSSVHESFEMDLLNRESVTQPSPGGGWFNNGAKAASGDDSDAESDEGSVRDEEADQRQRIDGNMPQSITNATMDGELRKLIKIAAEGRQIHHIQLYKPEGTSLGFSVVGLKSEQRGDLGIFIQEIQHNGIAAKDGRLRNGDQILAIDGQVLDSFISHQQAIAILQKANKLVELIVARAAVVDGAAEPPGVEAPPAVDKLLQTPEKTPPLVPYSSTHIVPPSTESRTSNMLNTEWAQVEVIQLVNDGSGLGFGIIGGRSTGVVVKTILPGGVADREGRLRAGDHILQIGDVNLRGMGSDQVASVLRQAGSHVRLVVARPVESATPDMQMTQYSAPVVETSVLNDPDELDRRLTLYPNVFPPTINVIANGEPGGGLPDIFGSSSASSTSTVPVGTAPNGHLEYAANDDFEKLESEVNQVSGIKLSSVAHPSEDSYYGSSHGPLGHTRSLSGLEGPVVEGGEEMSIADLPEMENITLDLVKDEHGLGITIAGYVCEKEELSGIFVKSVNAGSTADRSGQIQVNDQIIEVDGRELVGLSNHAAVEVLRSTGKSVQLRLIRYLRGPKFEQLQQAIANSELKTTPTTPNPPRSSMSDFPTSDEIQSALSQLDAEVERGSWDTPAIPQLQYSSETSTAPHTSIVTIKDSSEFQSVKRYPVKEYPQGANDSKLEHIELLIDTDYEGELQPAVKAAVIRKWHHIIGESDVEVVVAQLRKFEPGGGLGISLEGTVDVEDGREVRPHHYIRSILPDGPVGRDGNLQSGDELLEVNGRKLLGLNHVEVVTILKELPVGVRLVCGRQFPARSVSPVDETVKEGLPERGTLGGSLQSLVQSPERLVKAKSDGSLASSSNLSCDNVEQSSLLVKVKSRSLEPLTGLAMWSSEPQHIDLNKGARGLGFSILDYQDPMDPQDTVIVIRSLVPGGVAEKDGRLIPGDRLIAVNGVSLEKASLDEAVGALKGAPKGPVIISVAKPVNVLDSPGQLDFILRDRELGSSDGGSDDAEDQDLGEGEETARNRAEYARKRRMTNDSVLSTASSEDVPNFSPPAEFVGSRENDNFGIVLGQNERLIGGKSTSIPNFHREVAVHSITSHRQDVVVLPSELHRVAVIQRGADQLGFNVEVVDQGMNGVIVSSLVRGGPTHVDGRIQPGDIIIAVNNECLKGLSTSQVRSVLRKAQIGNPEIRITYVRGQDAANYRDSTLKSFSSDVVTVDSAQINSRSSRVVSDSLDSDSTPRSDLPRSCTAPSFVTKRSKSRESALEEAINPPTVVTVNSRSEDRDLEGRVNVTLSSAAFGDSKGSTESTIDGRTPSMDGKHWGPERRVEVRRDEKGSLGISIVGGKVDINWAGSPVAGIFVKNVLANSPAGRSGLLKTGDRILEVEGNDLRSTTHEKAVEIIKKTGNPVTFIVQSLIQWSSDSIPSPGDTMHLGSQMPDQVPLARTPSPVLIQPGLSDFERQMIGAQPPIENGALEKQESLHNQLDEDVKANLKDDDDISEMSSDDEDSRMMQGRIVNQQGIEIDRASAAALKHHEGDEPEDEFGYTMKKIKQRYGTDRGELVLVELQKGSDGLGISLAGHKERMNMSVFICGLNPSGRAHKDGKIHVGDEVLEVNGYVVEGRSHLNASTIFKGIPGPTVKILVRRKSTGLEEMAVKPLSQFPVSLQEETPEERYKSFKGLTEFVIKKGQSGLGIMIIEGKHAEYGNGIFISDLQEGSPAAEAGVMVGDMILCVNKDDMVGMDYDSAANILKQSEGVINMWVANITRSATPDGKARSPTPNKAETPKPVAEKPKEPSEADIRPGLETTIEIVKEKMGLGLSIVGGSDTLLGAIIIHEVYPDGAAAKDGRLKPGDQILEVNTEDFRSISHQKALSVLRQTPSKVKMVVYREAGTQEEDMYDIITVQLTKKSGKGLGLSIVGRKNGTGVFISDLVPSGVAESDGRLMHGDQILQVNDKDVRTATQEQAAAVLKCAPSSVTLKIGRLKPGKKVASPNTIRPLSMNESAPTSKSPSSLNPDFSFPEPPHLLSSHAIPQLQSPQRVPPPQPLAPSSPLPLRSVILERGDDGLGFSIVGGFGSNLGDLPIYVKSVFDRGAAAREGSLKRGDQIVQVNGCSLAGLTHAQAVSILKDAKGAVVLTILPSK